MAKTKQEQSFTLMVNLAFTKSKEDDATSDKPMLNQDAKQQDTLWWYLEMFNLRSYQKF